MPFFWHQAGVEHFMTAIVDRGEPVFRLSVEKIPDGPWDWLVWNSSDPRISEYGLAGSLGEARSLAESAASALARWLALGKRAGNGRWTFHRGWSGWRKPGSSRNRDGVNRPFP